ncbi:MAG TPA: hypothetical protein VFO55_04405 [Gemmatimonadaceae bacterium]|nr:hypothetical protein [Gemmatimonadaceae bacterium]
MRPTRAVFALSVVLSWPVAAQSNATPELIPRPLVEALLGRATTLVVGVLPPAVESKVVLPPGAKILGGSTNPAMATGIVILDGALNSVAERFQDDLLKGGWEVMDQAPMQFYGATFIDPPVAQRRAIATSNETFCGRAGTLTVRYEPEGFAQTRVHITSMATNRCAQMRDAMLQSRADGGPARLQPPVLFNPGAARSQMGICQANSFNYSSGGPGAQLASTMHPAEILSHYAKQLADSGWKESGTVATGVWTRRDSTGTAMEYQITVRAPEDALPCRQVEANLRTRRGR